MSAQTTTGPSSGDIVIRVVGWVLTGLFGVPFLLFSWIALSSRFGIGADVHGYGLIFGTILALLAGVLLMLVVPLVLPRGRRAVGYGISAIIYLVVAAGLIAAWFTA